MDRRDFLTATFAASAATVALAQLAPVPAVVERRVDLETGPLPQLVAPQAERVRVIEEGTTDLAAIAQYLLRALAQRLDNERWVTTLSEYRFAPNDALDGNRTGSVVWAFEPGEERFEGMREVVLSAPVSALWEVPRRFTGGRREMYSLVDDQIRNGPDVEALPVPFAALDPVVDWLASDIMARDITVFSPRLYQPKMSGSVEGSVLFASRTYGLAMRVVRCLGPEHELMMRADLLGGTFPRS